MFAPPGRIYTPPLPSAKASFAKLFVCALETIMVRNRDPMDPIPMVLRIGLRSPVENE